MNPYQPPREEEKGEKLDLQQLSKDLQENKITEEEYRYLIADGKTNAHIFWVFVARHPTWSLLIFLVVVLAIQWWVMSL